MARAIVNGRSKSSPNWDDLVGLVEEVTGTELSAEEFRKAVSDLRQGKTVVIGGIPVVPR